MKNFEHVHSEERILSDVEKVKGGAKLNKEGSLEFTGEQVEEVREEMELEKKSRREELFKVQGLEEDRHKVLERLVEELRPTVAGLNETGWEGENLELPDNLRAEIGKVVKDTMSDPMAGRCRKIRDFLNEKYRHLAGADIRKYRNLLNDKNLEKFFDEVDNIKSIRDQRYWLEKIQIK